MHKLKITNCKNHIEEFTLSEGSHTIGRSLDSTIRLESDEVSRIHARLLVNPNHCVLIDEHSKNGTFIHNNRIQSHYLHDGDIINIGRFNIHFLSDSAKPHFIENKEPKIKIIAVLLVIGLVFFASFSFYQKTQTKKVKLKLAERTAQYLAEKNKESLYLGEYDSIDLTKLPPGITQAAVWDRNGVLRSHQPVANPPPDVRGRASNIQNEISTPIYYESTKVGTLWIKYKL